METDTLNTNTLTVQTRTEMGKGFARRMRRQGMIPAIAYAKGNTPFHFSVSSKDFMKKMTAKGRSTILEINFENSELAKVTVMLKKLQRHPVTRNPMHVDFLIIDPSKSVQTSVKIILEGKAVGIALGGQVDFIRRQANIECLPADIPVGLSLDMTELTIGDTFHVSNLKAISGVKVLDDGELAVVTMSGTVEEEEETSDSSPEKEA